MQRSLHAIIIENLKMLPAQTQAFIQTCLYGLVGGLGATLFLTAINLVYASTIKRFASEDKILFLIRSLGTLVGVSLITGWLLNRFAPEAAGSGIPQQKLAFWKDFGFVPSRVPLVKFIAGVLSIGGGMSLGREGPSVQLGGSLASCFAGWLGEPKQNRRLAAAAGSAAGLAAAFNTPLAATFFVLEEIVADLNSRYLGSALIASVIGALVVHAILGPHPAFPVHSQGPPGWEGYLLTPLVAAAAALTGILLHTGITYLREKIRRKAVALGWLKPVIGGLTTWLLGVVVFLRTGHLGVFGLGYEDLTLALSGGLAWKVAVLLLAAKLVATVVCYASGGCGGIFAPSLFMGGMVGAALSRLLGSVLPLSSADELCMIVVGMACCLNAVVMAPVTTILIVFEMTREYSLVPALMLGAIISYGLAKRLTHKNLYEHLLEQDGYKLEHVIPPRNLESWHQLPISAITNFRPIVIYGLSEESIRDTLQRYPFERFPVVNDGKIIGILRREEAEEALRERRRPTFEPAIVCAPNERIHDLEHKLIQSTANMVLVVQPGDGRLIGIVTLHDLLRAEVLMSQRGV